MKDFIQQALQTEAPITPELMNRYLRYIGNILDLFHEIGRLARCADDYKKQIFYGKGAAAPPALDYKTEPETIRRYERLVRDVHGAIGKLTEVGELVEHYSDHVISNVPLDAINIMEEIGDGLWYDAIICDARSLTIEQCQERVIAKLRQRYPNQFTEYDAQNRDLEKERQVLELDNLRPYTGKELIDLTKASDKGNQPATLPKEDWIGDQPKPRIGEPQKLQAAYEQPDPLHQLTVKGIAGTKVEAGEVLVWASPKEIKKLQDFKEYVHKRLDEIGVPTFAEADQSKDCRIHMRLDWIESRWKP
jgi:hypothetical protein